jgi:hypothetical protein
MWDFDLAFQSNFYRRRFQSSNTAFQTSNSCLHHSLLRQADKQALSTDKKADSVRIVNGPLISWTTCRVFVLDYRHNTGTICVEQYIIIDRQLSLTERHFINLLYLQSDCCLPAASFASRSAEMLTLLSSSTYGWQELNSANWVLIYNLHRVHTGTFIIYFLKTFHSSISHAHPKKRFQQIPTVVSSEKWVAILVPHHTASRIRIL